MKEFIFAIVAVAIFFLVVEYVYPKYTHMKEVCEANVYVKDAYDVVPIYYIAMGDEWKSEPEAEQPQTVLFYSDEKEPSVDPMKVRSSYDSKDSAVKHCMLYFNQYDKTATSTSI